MDAIEPEILPLLESAQKSKNLLANQERTNHIFQMLKLNQMADIIIDVANPGTQYGQKLSKTQKVAAVFLAYFIIVATSCACLFVAYLLLRAHHYFIAIIPVYIAFCFLYKLTMEITEMVRRINKFRKNNNQQA